MALAQLRTRLARLAACVPSTAAPGMMTSEQAICSVASLVERMKTEGVKFRDVSGMTDAELIAQAIAEIDEEEHHAH